MKNRCPKCNKFTRRFIHFGTCRGCHSLIMGNRVISDQRPTDRPAIDLTPNQITFLFSDDQTEIICIIPEQIKNRLSRFGYEEHDLMVRMLNSFFDEMEVFHAENKN